MDMMMIYPNEHVITDTNFIRFIAPHADETGTRKKGLVPRDWDKFPQGSLAGEVGMHAIADLPAFNPSDFPKLIQLQLDEGRRLSDFRAVKGPGGKMIPARDQNGKGYCLEAGTLVTMADETFVPIERVKAGDRVITHTGAQGVVIKPTSRRYTGRMIHMAGQDSYQAAHVTEGHQFWTPEGEWVEAKNLNRTRHVFYAGRPTRVADYLSSTHVVEMPVYCLQVEGDESFIANGYAVHNCWRHSCTSAHLLLRAAQDMPYVDLSAYAGACRIKNYRDEGGWGAQGLQDIMDFGDPSSEFWPQQSMSRSNDKPETWANAKLHTITEGFIDLGSPEYDRTMTVNQMITCLLLGIPVITDFNWWSHSVCAMDVVNGATQWKVTRAGSGKLMKLPEFEAFWGMHTVMAGIAIRILNSWGDSWSESGAGLLTGSKAVPDGATAPRLASWSLSA